MNNTYKDEYSDLFVVRQRLESLQQAIRDMDKKLTNMNQSHNDNDTMLLLRQMLSKLVTFRNRIIDQLEELKDGEKAKS